MPTLSKNAQKKSQQISAKIPLELYKQMKLYGLTTGLSNQDIISQSLMEFIQNHPDEFTMPQEEVVEEKEVSVTIPANLNAKLQQLGNVDDQTLNNLFVEVLKKNLGN